MFWCDELQEDEQIECILNGHPEWSVKCIEIQKVRKTIMLRYGRKFNITQELMDTIATYMIDDKREI